MVTEPFPELLAALHSLTWRGWPRSIPESLEALEEVLQAATQQVVEDLGALKTPSPRLKRSLMRSRADLVEGLEQAEQALWNIWVEQEIARWFLNP